MYINMDKSLVDQIYKGDLVITISGLIKFVQSLPLALINKKALAQHYKKCINEAKYF